jgi:putative ABC transport system permease protein
MSTDSSAFVINEAAVKSAVAKLGEAWRSPIGKRLDYYTSYHAEWRIHKSGPVIGVVKDFNYRSLHHEVGPIALQIGPQALFHLVVKIKSDHVGEALALLEDKWKTLFPDRPFNYHFLDENLGRQYHAEKKAEQIITALAFWAIFIACLGLFGLAAFMAELRTKEIGVRKVLGASVTNLFGLLAKDFVKLLLLANLAAWPIAYYAADAWLQNFTYRIELGWLTFVAAAALTMMIALFTVGYQILKSASTNPVEALRYE